MKSLIFQKIISISCISITSVFFGYAFWFMLSYQNIITYSVDIPLFFYNIPEKASVNAPTHIKALVKGKRKDLALLPFKSSIHCNAEHFTSEPKNLKLKKEHIFLPEGVQLINCSFLSKIFITTSH